VAQVRRRAPAQCRSAAVSRPPELQPRRGEKVPVWRALGVDRAKASTLYSGPYGAPSAYGVIARLRSSSLKTVTTQPASGRGRRLRWLSGSPEGGIAKVPGCLTGESEERETWTAESLRTASSKESNFRTRNGQEETSAVNVSGQHQWSLVQRKLYRRLKVGPRQTCDQPRSDLSNLRV